MDFEKAIQAHMQWKISLRKHLMGGEPLEKDPSSHTACELGKWILESSRAVGGPEFQALNLAHQEFHKAAARVMQLAKTNKTQAMQYLDGEYTQRSLKVVAAIKGLQSKMAA